MSTLILTLPLTPPGPHSPFGYLVSPDGHQIERQGQAAPALLPPQGRAGETVAVVPVRALSWLRVALPQNLPLNNAPRLRAVLDGLLEDRLLDDPAQLHFALQPGARAGESAWVAVCSRAWLLQCLQQLEAAGRPVARIVPEFAPLAASAEYFALGSPGDAQLLATSQGEEQALALLPLAAAPALLAEVPSQNEDSPTLQADPAVAELVEDLLGRPVQIVTAAERALRAARSDWDLAQLDLASHGRTRLLRKAGSAAGALLRAPQWRAARWGAALLLGAHLLGLNAWAWQERQALAAKQAQVRSLLKQTFPQIQVVVDAPVQMQRELAQLRQGAGGISEHDLEPLLATTGQALQGIAGASLPQAIDYQNGELRLRGLDVTGELSATLRERLAGSGYQAQASDSALTIRPEAQP
ncbi:general secretion pathway protein GspL [Acidovorax sp. HDW3]|uniref:type II secretion system protein GspL n=1 Tax=Acidovorax sp. HDW3 TaxID=2714923 RepID=UPI00140782E0|nr:type II secretion system protein GspL [Acidovorax sp. HDW3]QIL45045.1 general secretion pathway protein GspL [Acidovorax sp. HDW3]